MIVMTTCLDEIVGDWEWEAFCEIVDTINIC